MIGLFILFSSQLLVVLLKFLKLVSGQIMINFIRFSYGAFLIFSGFIKIIDPIGFSYKLEKYFILIPSDVISQSLIDLGLYISIFVCFFEILLGILLIYGRYVKPVVWLNLLLMIFFTFLTFFAAVTGKITDCGCFGDFLKLDPWHSFYKDIHLLFVSILLLLLHYKIKPLFNVNTTVRLLFVDFLLLIVFTVYTLSYIPVIDFRPYHVGANIPDSMVPCNDSIPGKECPKEDNVYLVEHKTTGEKLEILGQDYSSNYKEYADDVKYLKTIIIKDGYTPKITDFVINSESLTQNILSMDTVFLVIAYDLEKSNVKGHQKINNYLVDSLSSKNLPIFGLSSTISNGELVDDDIQRLNNLGISYPYFNVDEIPLKTMIRANPGVFMLEKGVVTHKWHWRSVPKDISSIINP